MLPGTNTSRTSRSSTTGMPGVGRGGSFGARSARSRANATAPLIDVPQVLDYFKSNPMEAAKLYAQLVAEGVMPGMGIARSLAEKDMAGAGLAAAAAVPIPGVGGVAKGAAAAAKAAKVAGTASRAAKAAETAAAAASRGARAATGAGRTEAAVAADVAKAASRRTAAESATIRRGTQAGRTAEKAAELEAQAAKDAARTSVNAGRTSTVVPRTGKPTADVPKWTTADRVEQFAKTRGVRPATQVKRTPKQVKQATADIKETMSRALARRDAGVDDIPASTGRGIYEKPPPAGLTPKQARNKVVTDALTKPTNPGKNASAAAKAKYKKDLAAWKLRQETMASNTKNVDEGYRAADLSLKGPAAKSAARKQRKAAGTKRPSASSPAKPTPSARGEGAKPGTDLVPSGTKPKREPIDLVTRPVGEATPPRARGRFGDPGPGAPRPHGGKKAIGPKVKRARGNYGDPGPGAPRPHGGTAEWSAAPGPKGSKFKKMGKRAAVGAAGMAALGTAGWLVADKVERDQAAAGTDSKKPAVQRDGYTGYDKYGRKISRAEWNRRIAEKRARSAAGLNPDERYALWEKQMARRKRYRKGLGEKAYGEAARTKKYAPRVKRGVKLAQAAEKYK